MRCAVILAGCGHMDGSEIRESVFVMLELSRLKVDIACFSCDSKQKEVVDHVTKKVTLGEQRNIMSESARIARGEIKKIEEIRPSEFDMVIVPGGLGVAKNYSNLLDSDGEAAVDSRIKDVITGFYKLKKIIGGVCISPALLVLALSKIVKIKVTIGDDRDGLISKLGGEHVVCATNSHVVDEKNRIFSCSAYMRDDDLYDIFLGIRSMVEGMVNFIGN